MGSIPAKVAERLAGQLKRFQGEIADAQKREAAEADTAHLVRLMLCELFGYKDNTEVTGEFLIQGHYCDLAIKNADTGKPRAMIEVKSIGTALNQRHLDQAVGYASKHGTDWAVLTNAATWRVYRVVVDKSVEQELVIEIDFPSLSHKNDNDLELLYLFCQEGWARDALDDYDTEREALSGFILSAVLTSEPVIKAVRRELRKVFPDVKASVEQLQAAIETSVVRREVIDGDKFVKAKRLVARRVKKHDQDGTSSGAAAADSEA